MRYWIYKDTQITGPYAQEELPGLEGLGPDTLVCREDAAQEGDCWQALESIPELAELCLVLTSASGGSSVTAPAGHSSGFGAEDLGLVRYWDRFLDSPKEKNVGRVGKPDLRVRELTAQIEGLLRRIGELENQQDQLLAQLGEKRAKESEFVPKLAEKDRLVETLHAKVQGFESQQGELLRQLADKDRASAHIEGLTKRFEELISAPQAAPEPAPAQIPVLRQKIAPKSWPKAAAQSPAEPSAPVEPAVKIGAAKRFARVDPAPVLPPPAKEPEREIEIVSEVPAVPEPAAAPPKEETVVKASFAAPEPAPESAMPFFTPEPEKSPSPPMPSFEDAMSPAMEVPAVPALPPMTMSFSPPVPAAAAPPALAPEASPADLSVDTDEVISRLAKHSGATQPTAPKPKRPQSKAFVVVIALSTFGLLVAGFLFFRNTKEIKMMFNMGAGQGAIGTEVDEALEGELEKPRPAQPLDPAVSQEAPTAAPKEKEQAVSDPIPQAIELVKGYPLDGERASVGQWLQYSFSANPGNGSKETWDAGAVDATTYLVRYTVVPGGSGSSAGEPITYLFEADLSRKTVLGKNSAARQLLSGTPARKPKAKARPAKRRAAAPKPKKEVPLLPLPTETELLPPAEDDAPFASDTIN